MTMVDSYRTPQAPEKIAAAFKPAWYEVTYRRDIALLKQPQETSLDFYLRIGARLGHDPHAGFSELFFRSSNPRAYRRLQQNPQEFGYLLFLNGFRESLFRKARQATPSNCESWRALTTAVNRQFIAAHNSIDYDRYISELDYYIQRSREELISPSADFSEERYRELHPEIHDQVRRGEIVSGFHHFLANLEAREQVLAKVAAGFASDWYQATYRRDLEQLKNPQETALDFYLRIGGRLGHDPHPDFSELFFRTFNPDVYDRLRSHPDEFGYFVFLQQFEGRPFRQAKVAGTAQSENWRALTAAIDRQFVAATYKIDYDRYISELDYYIQSSRHQAISPSADFSEEFYREQYPDIADLVRHGHIISGYHQFIATGGVTRSREQVQAKLAASFASDWYQATYRRDLEQLKNPQETALDFYLRAGGRLGHDPHPDFSELFFRTFNPDVYDRLRSHPDEFGYFVFLQQFEGQPFRQARVATAAQSENWRALTAAIDRQFVAATYKIDYDRYISELDYYIQSSRHQAISPSADFSEEFYRMLYPDIANSVQRGHIISGFHQFIASGGQGRETMSVENFAKEKGRPIFAVRKSFEQNLPGITRANEWGYILEFEYLTAPVTVHKRGQNGPGFLVFIPYYFPAIFFGGYLAFFRFLQSLKQQQQGGQLKLVIVKKMPETQHLQSNIEQVRQRLPDIAELFSDYHLLMDSRAIEVDGDYGVISYCAETHFVASDAARQLNVTPIFFVQDYELDFHPAGSLRTFVRSSFELPHVGIYNSRKLYEYFRDLSDIGRIKDPDYRYTTFENTIRPMPWDWETFQARHAAKNKKRLIVYARPETLGARNELAIIVLALRKAQQQGYFDDDWILQGVGSMLPQPPVALGGGRSMEMLPKMPLAEYEESILLGDVGISLISTPHPGIIHFQMASFGLMAVTYETPARNADWLKSQSKNLIPSGMTIDGLCHAIRQAVDLSADLRTRHANALQSKVHVADGDIAAAAKFALNLG